MRRTLRWLIVGFGFLGTGCSAFDTNPYAPPPPNIIVIMADDHAQRAISAYGSPLIQTPNIDRLADEGILFSSSFVTNSICAPSRAVLLTGQYSHRNGLRDNRDQFDGSQMTFPKLLQQAGYETAVVGKWHLKDEPTGFDHWKILIGQGHYYSPVFLENGEQVEYPGYVTDVVTDLALDFLETRDHDKPFLLLYQHSAPHRNWMPSPQHVDLFADQDLPLPPTFEDDYRGRPAAESADMRIDDLYLSFDLKLQADAYGRETGTGGNAEFDAEASWQASYERMSEEEKAAWDEHYGPINADFKSNSPNGTQLTIWKYQRFLKDYLRCVASIDDNLGRLLGWLDRHGLADDTIVIYTSDQGFFLGEHGWYDKRFMYEPSMKTPLIIRYPAGIEPGRVSDALVVNLDTAPTLLDFAGVAVPPVMQGKSLRPLTLGRTPADWRQSVYYHYYEYPHGWHDVRPHYGIRTDRYKLIHFYGELDAWELYDLEKDPNEIENLFGREGYGTVTGELTGRLRALQREYGDEMDHTK
ncbi:MAG: sulfatase-like hydrolase/transferase [Acidobacteria bacterium]|nr:sulfatase-like hydrolase/transferase [Acidobacteriota bacterium]